MIVLLGYRFDHSLAGTKATLELAVSNPAMAVVLCEFAERLCREGLTDEVVEATRAKLKEQETIEEMKMQERSRG